jgi:hypothetical protein
LGRRGFIGFYRTAGGANRRAVGIGPADHGFAETEASITNKLKRGTFSATFFLACIAALELEGVVLEEI